MGKATKPWTWKQISKLKGKALAAFLEAYGERGQVARLVAELPQRPKGQLLTFRPCPINLKAGPCPILSDRWTRREERARSCTDLAPLVYARMVAKLGRLPEGRA